MTESSTSAVEQAVQARIAAARIRVQAAKERRQSLAEARRYGIARRHAAKLAHLAEQEQRQGDDHRASVRTPDRSATPTDGAATTTEENQ
ncbi:hypothetical protein [Streptomyces sp. SID12501]|uniref:Uncharacterized protein n=1 Tax=Streptomyces sp. SID12501 TaxID=2706042 RepID=A0A6B3C7A2_9ACTN|nr:hypothetical protein [Streptomyces sp. SID12501]NEC92202.1 hypothetical protein [Streptomyces sp. SID12501]